MGDMGETSELAELAKDPASQMVLDALGRATAAPGGLPLFGSRHGLCPTNAAGRRAAQMARDAGLFRALCSEKRGRVATEICAITQKGLARLLEGNGPASWRQAVLSFLAQWQRSGASGDCPIPELYRQATAAAPCLSVGLFHDGLRSLYDQERIYLHPWTGSLHELPDPACALLVGHEVAYYASLRAGVHEQHAVA